MAHRKHLTLAFALLAVSVFAFGCAEESAAPGQQQDEAPVLAPTNLQATVVDGGSIFISWHPSSQANVIGYNVYRVDLTDDSVEALNRLPVAATSAIDRSTRFGRDYEYRVTTVSDRNTESRFATVTIQNREAPPQDRHNRKRDDVD